MSDTPTADSPTSKSPDAIMDDRWEDGIAGGMALATQNLRIGSARYGLSTEEYLARRRAGTLPPLPTTE